MKKKKIVKRQKPIEHDIHLKYKCPTCDQHHWLAFREAKTKNFKVVCSCKTTFSPVQINKFKISYAVLKKEKLIIPASHMPVYQKQEKIIEDKTPVVQQIDVPENILEECVMLLSNYGFTKKESSVLVKKIYSENPGDPPAWIVKGVLLSLRNTEKTNGL